MSNSGIDATAGLRQPAACGSWTSPFRLETVAGTLRGLSSLRADESTLYWLESRPDQGRTVLCRCEAGEVAAQDVTPDEFDIGSRVHEYGGGAYAVQDGRIAFSRRTDGAVWLLEPDQPPRCLVAASGLRYADLQFTPDGHDLVAVREDHRGGDGHPLATIVLLSLDRAGCPAPEGEILVEGPDFLSSPRLSPDGQRLAWIEWDHPFMPWERTRLRTAVLARDAGVRTLVERHCVAGADRAEALMQPLFSPDGVLHACSDRTGWWNIYRAEAEGLVAVCPMRREIGVPPWIFGQRSYGFLPDGSLIAAVIEDGRCGAFRLAGGTADALPIGAVVECPTVLVAGSGAIALGWVGAGATDPAAVMRGPMSGPGHSLAQAHELAVDEADVSVAEVLHYPGAGGGTGHAFFYPPANSRFRVPDDERPPLMVIVHGGPTGMTSDALSLRVQWWTSRGIAVLDVNYCGSTGFGRAYREALDGAWGVADVDDCVAACDALVTAGRVDAERIAIRGSSAGGFTVLAALTQSRRFGAGTCIYGIGDLASLARDTHKFEAHYLDRLVGPLPEAAATYEARSPINHLDRLGCPVIFFHGTEDRVVPIAQARMMAQAMRERGIPHALHEFEGEGHGFRRADSMRRLLALEFAFYGELFGFTPASTA